MKTDKKYDEKEGEMFRLLAQSMPKKPGEDEDEDEEDEEDEAIMPTRITGGE